MRVRRETGIGARLKQERERRGWSQSKLAKRAGCSSAQVSRLEAGISANVSAALQAAFEAALGLARGALSGVPSPSALKASKSLDDFLSGPLASDEKVTDDEADDMRLWHWYGPDEAPTQVDWLDFLRLRRRMRSRSRS